MIKNKFIKNLKHLTLLSFCIFLLIYCFFIPSVAMSSDDSPVKKNVVGSNSFVFENIAQNVPDDLTEKVKLYWQYQGSKDLESAYTIESPHIKYQMSFEMYSRYHKKARKLNGCRILNLESTGDRANVRVELLFDDKEKVLKPSEKSRFINDLWIDLDGKWYHVYVNPFANIR